MAHGPENRGGGTTILMIIAVAIVAFAGGYFIGSKSGGPSAGDTGEVAEAGAAAKAAATGDSDKIPIGDSPIRRGNFPGDVTVVVSEHTRQLLVTHGVSNVVRVFPPLDATQLRPRSPVGEVAAALDLGPRAVLYPAHYGPKSGISEMIAAFARLPAALADAILVLACRTHPHQDRQQEEERVRQQAAAHGISKRVRILGNVADMPALIAACAVTTLVPGEMASKMDLPLVVLESLALARPVIVSDRPPISESLLRGGGEAVPHGDVPALAAALTRLLTDASLRAALGSKGQQAVLEQCQPDAVVARFQAIYQSLDRRRPVRS